MPFSSNYRADPRILELAPDLSDAVTPAQFPQATLRFRNQRHAARVGMAELDPAEWQQYLHTFAPLPGNLAQPLAMRYHGHQFGSYNSNLGDGRGFTFAQVRDDRDRLLDLGTKGSGRTPYSRGGDGKLTLKGGVREILATEMLEASGVETSKTFSVFETGEALFRGDEPSPTRSCVLVRLGHAHLRFGSFQRLAYLRQVDPMQRLCAYIGRHHLPEVAAVADSLPSALLHAIVVRSARLCAQWMVAGFVHGVLNTDNMNVTGESFDYGPFRFLPRCDPQFTAAYFDHNGLYAFGRQPETVRWNLEMLAAALTTLAPPEALAPALAEYETAYYDATRTAFFERLGLQRTNEAADHGLIASAYAFLLGSPVGYDQFYFDWYGGMASAHRAQASPAAAFYQGEAFATWRAALADFAPSHPERLALPYFASAQPCTLLIDEVEALWTPIAERDDWAPLEAKIADIRAMGAVWGRG